MNKRRITVAVIGLVVFAAGVTGYFVWKGRDAPEELRITNFAECVAAGNEIPETDPAQCRTADGKTFVDETPTPSATPTLSEEPVTAEHTSLKGVSLVVDAPLAGDLISSPITLRGKVPGSWSFEADFGVEIYDANGQQIGDGFATLQGEWMTEDLVDFTGTVSFDKPKTSTGTVVLRRANPADESRFDDSVTIPITFSN